MLSLRSVLTAGLVAAGFAATGGPARADGIGCSGPFCNQAAYPKHYSLLGHAGGGIFGPKHAPPPVYQAAPWYLYWPYDGHFLTPAPVTGAFYGPPSPGNFPVNPYFPGPGYAGFAGYGAGYGFGQFPGGPPPYTPGYPPNAPPYNPGITPGMPIPPSPIPPGVTPGTNPGGMLPPVTPGTNPGGTLPPVTPGKTPAPPPITPGTNPVPITPGTNPVPAITPEKK